MRAGAGAAAPQAIETATADQPAARLALAAAIAAPSHAYLLAGSPGSGKREAARAFAAELLAAGADDADDARRRALADPSPHPDLVWVRPPGAQHLVGEIRERVINAAAYRPFEGERRVFVIEAAEAMADEGQNALLKTLEEPAPYAHLLLVSAEPEALLETVRSRCQLVRFTALSPEVLEARLAKSGPEAGEDERRAAARLAAGDATRALALLSPEGRALRDAAIDLVRASRADELGGAPWGRILDVAEVAGERAAEATREEAAARAAEEGEGSAQAKRRLREGEEAARRAGRRARTDVLDLGLGLVTAWLRDLAATAAGGAELALNADRAGELAEAAQGLDPARALRCAEAAMETRHRLQVNVSEELALETLSYRLADLLGGAGAG